MKEKYLVLIFSDNIGNPSKDFTKRGVAGLLHCVNVFLKPLIRIGTILNRKVVFPLPWICLSISHNKKNELDKTLNWDSFYNLEDIKNLIDLNPPFSFGDNGSIVTNYSINFYPSNINLSLINNEIDILALVNLTNIDYNLKIFSGVTATKKWNLLSKTEKDSINIIKLYKFKISNDLKVKAQEIINKIKLKNFVFIHIRRGDFLDNKILAPPDGTRPYTSVEVVSEYIKQNYDKDRQIIIATNERKYNEYTDKLKELVDNNLIFEYDFYKVIDQKYIENNYFFYLILSEIANNAEINVITVKLKIGDKYHDSLEEFYYNKFIKNV